MWVAGSSGCGWGGGRAGGGGRAAVQAAHLFTYVAAAIDSASTVAPVGVQCSQQPEGCKVHVVFIVAEVVLGLVSTQESEEELERGWTGQPDAPASPPEADLVTPGYLDRILRPWRLW